MTDRRKMGIDIFKRFKNKPDACIKDGKLYKNINIFNRIGTESKNGEVLKACYPKNCKYDLAIKKIPLDEFGLRYISKRETIEGLNASTTWSELFFLKLITELVKHKICPNLPFVYKTIICDDCAFENIEVLRYYPDTKGCALVITELADGDLNNWLLGKRSTMDILLCYFQIYMGLYCIRKYFNIWHHDLHAGNVLYHKIPPGGFFKYNVKGEIINIPNNGFLFVLWDFGYSRIPKFIEPVDNKFLYKRETSPFEDVERINYMLKHSGSIDSYTMLKDVLKKSHSYANLLINLYKLIRKPSINQGKMIGYYNTEKKINIEKIIKNLKIS